MKGKFQFIGYSTDRWDEFRKAKQAEFHLKNGRFATRSLTNSRENTMIEPGPMATIENLYEEYQEKSKLIVVTRKSRLL